MPPSATLTPDSLPVALALLRATVVTPWESVDQVIADHGHADLGDPLTPGTGAWHLRHIVEIFRLHARTTIVGLGGGQAADSSPTPEAGIPRVGGWTAQAARDELLADVETFAGWLSQQPASTLSRRFRYGRELDLLTMFSVIQQHITWHAAAVHYWVKWKRG